MKKKVVWSYNKWQSILPALLFFTFFTGMTASAQTVGLYMRDFEGLNPSCPKNYFGCSNDDTGGIASCKLVNCGTTNCWLWISNDMWIDYDDDNDGAPDGGTSYAKTSSNFPEQYVQARVGKKNLVMARVLFHDDFMTGLPESFVYHLKIKYVDASSAVTLLRFNANSNLIKDVEIHFSRAIVNNLDRITMLNTPTPDCHLYGFDLASTQVVNNKKVTKAGFVAVVPWTNLPPIPPGTSQHYCLLAELEKTSPPGAFDALNTTIGACINTDPNTDFNGFYDYVSCNDNVIWRNIQIIGGTSSPAPRTEGAQTSMQVNSPGSENTLTAVELQTTGDIQLSQLWTSNLDWSALPMAVRPDTTTMLRYNESLRYSHWSGDFSKIPLTGGGLIFPPMKLPPRQSFPLQLNFVLNPGMKDSKTRYRNMVHVMQYQQEPGKERQLVGGNSILLFNKAPAKPKKKCHCFFLWCWIKALFGG
jgi:hypothetical protein